VCRTVFAQEMEMFMGPVFPQDFEGVKHQDAVWETVFVQNSRIQACPWWDLVEYFQEESYNALGIPH
jgi:hypothetical protein